jgi:hypothetical protein
MVVLVCGKQRTGVRERRERRKRRRPGMCARACLIIMCLAALMQTLNTCGSILASTFLMPSTSRILRACCSTW